MAVDRVRQNNSGGLTLATVTVAQLAIDREPTRQDAFRNAEFFLLGSDADEHNCREQRRRDDRGKARVQDEDIRDDGANHRAGEDDRADANQRRYEQQQRATDLQRPGQVPKPVADPDAREDANPGTVRAEFLGSDR